MVISSSFSFTSGGKEKYVTRVRQKMTNSIASGKIPSNGINGIIGPRIITINPMIMDETIATKIPRRILNNKFSVIV
jgi:hypothetical protein